CFLFYLLYCYTQTAFVLLIALATFMWWIIVPFTYYNRRKCRDFWCTGTDDVRCSCNLDSGELYFSKENVTYQSEEYRYLCIACIYGMAYAYRNGKHAPINMPQLSILILLNDGTWKRHVLTVDALHIYKRKLKKFSKYFQCPVIIKNLHGQYDFIDECPRFVTSEQGKPTQKI
ncbi:MAG: hypothetical protein Q4F84_03940, partial [Fibrobacter sp.]|nr:hypothetical protein [Fibrobacter sp.]